MAATGYVPMYYPPAPPQSSVVVVGGAGPSSYPGRTKKVTKIVKRKGGNTYNLNFKKTHRGGKRSRKRLRRRKVKPEEAIKSAKMGPQLPISASSNYTLSALMDKMKELNSSADGLVHRFKHAITQLWRDHDKKLPASPEVPLDIQHMVIRSLRSRSGKKLELAFINENGERVEATPAKPLINSERVVSASFMLPAGAFTTMIGHYAFEISLGSQKFVHEGIFSDKDHVTTDTFHWMINLYDPAYAQAYHEFAIPLPVLVVTLTRSRTNDRLFAASKAVLTVDFDPRKHFVSLPTKASDIRHVPSLTSHTHIPYASYFRDNVPLQAALHKNMSERLSALMASSQNSWAFRCSAGAVAGDVEDKRVVLGDVAEAAIAYAVMAMLAEKKKLELIDDPSFAKEIIGVDDNGAKAIDVVRSLYDKYHMARERERTPEHQDFPSILQLLAHTSGLPAFRSISCDQVRSYYDQVIKVLSGSSEQADELTYDQREELVLTEFESSSGAVNDAAVSVGPSHNIMELFLLAMIVRRFTEGVQQSPADAVNAYVQPSEFVITWGAPLAGIDEGASAVDPLVFSMCATSTFSGVVAHAQAMTNELAQPTRDNSIFFEMLSTRFAVPGENRDVAHSIGWMQRRVNDKLDLIYVGSRNRTIDTVVLAIIPQLRYFAVFHEMSSDFSQPLQTSVESVVDVINDVLASEEIYQLYKDIPNRVVLDVSRPSRAEKTWDSSFLNTLSDTFRVTAALPGEAVSFIDPFITQAYPSLRTVKFVRDDDRGVLAKLVFSDGEEVPLIYDPRRNNYYVRLYPDSDDGALGSEVIVRPGFIQFDGKIYIEQSNFNEFNTKYVQAYDTSMELAGVDIFRGAQTAAVKQGVMTPVSPDQFFGLSVSANVDAHIGHRWRRPVVVRRGGGGFGRGLLSGMALGALPYWYGRPAPAYYYGTPYYRNDVVYGPPPLYY